MVVAKALREGLGSASAAGTTSTTSFTLSPDLAIQALPAVVSTVQTLWGHSPYAYLPATEQGLGRVLEFTIRDAGSGAEVPLPPLAPTAANDSLPVQFLMALGACCAQRAPCLCP